MVKDEYNLFLRNVAGSIPELYFELFLFFINKIYKSCKYS